MSASSNNQHETKTNYFTPIIATKYVNSIWNLPLHNEWISSLIYDALEIQPGHRLVDMGCGPGSEIIKILKKTNNDIHIIGVDPSQGMLDVLKKESESNPNIETVCMDAITFSQSIQYSPYDRIFLKDIVHLLTHEERAIAFEGFYKQLAVAHGKLLIIHGSIDGEIFPFDERTRSLFRKGNDLETLFDELKCAGFKQIQQQTSTFEYPLNSVQAEDWIYLIENRLWTLFSKENMNEQQMKSLIDHVRRQYESLTSFQTMDKRTIIKCCVE